MAEETTVLGGVVDFIAKLGFYDVVLPFLLTFTLVYAILDKTRVFGEEGEGKGHPKRNLNAIIALVIGMLVIFVKPLVATINEALANIVVLMIIGVFFMVLVAIFMKEGQHELKEIGQGWQTFFVWFMFIGIMLIFLHALKISDGRTWLQVGLDFVGLSWSSSIAASVLFVIGLVAFIWFVTKPNDPDKNKNKDKEEGQ
jgi:hypothetical protein